MILTHNTLLIHTSFSYSKWNMDEIFGLKFHLAYRISSYSCRGNYSFLNSSSEETIQGEETTYSREETIRGNSVDILLIDFSPILIQKIKRFLHCYIYPFYLKSKHLWFLYCWRVLVESIGLFRVLVSVSDLKQIVVSVVN